ncbi:biotin transporter BioY [Actinomadura sp. KC06]|uniref:biotin transporter BioY n=1 Tax=Actinomadura sp. KC06 TaxID=2530369 RepID=UPI00104DAA7F|nr:biotin transporter BioY [Actinomadura sp. KC06]TDD34243.1 biotin transporter BioY [Actinomadura sp. KC06]
MSTLTLTGPRPVLADLLPRSLAGDMSLVVSGAALTGLAAQVAIHTPLSPVPFTLQTLAVLLVGTALGVIRGVAAMALYLVAGLAGVPWFSEGEHGFVGASFGYIVGFVLAAAVVGRLAEGGADRRVSSMVALMALGVAVIYGIGATWLALLSGLSPGDALTKGVTPFLAADAVKIAIAALAFPVTWRLARR